MGIHQPHNLPPSLPLTDSSEAPANTRCGMVALVGLPNAGKSTLLNGLLGERLSIVTAKAQTTRKPVTGIRSDETVQVIFRDTPGLLRVENLLQRSMRGMAQKEIHDSDAVVLVLDGSRPPSEGERERLNEALTDRRSPLLAVVNKIDRADGPVVAGLQRWATETLNADVLAISATSGEGMDDVWTWIVDHMPESPFLYDADDLSTDSVLFFVAELVRETAFEQYRQEIPYSIVCTVDEFREGEEPVFIRVVVNVERNSQKGIVVGKGGVGIRELGSKSRAKIETLLGESVYLDLWVKVLEGWRSRATALKQLGFTVPEDEEGQ